MRRSLTVLACVFAQASLLRAEIPHGAAAMAEKGDAPKALRAASESGAPWAVDESFVFGETNITTLRDIELFSDGRIAYGGKGTFGTTGVANPDGSVTNPEVRGWRLQEAKGVAVDRLDEAIFSAGIGVTELDPAVQRATSWDDFDWNFGDGFTGVATTVVIDGDRRVVAGGRFQVGGDTNQMYGLVRLTLAGKVDAEFSYAGSAGLEVTSAVLLSDGGILAAYQQTNENGVGYGYARWTADGVASEAPSFRYDSRVSAMRNVPGTNLVLLAHEQPTNEVLYTKFSWVTGEGIVAGGETWPVVEGTVLAIAFEAVTAETVAAGGWDRVLIAGEFTKVGETECRNLASIGKDGQVVWAFPPEAGPDAPIQAVEVQLDGKVLIAGSFTNVNGVEARGMSRIVGDGATNGATYLYWADSEFRGFEGGPASPAAVMTMRRSGDLSEPLTVFLESEHSQLGELVNLPEAFEFAAGAGEASIEIDVLDNFQRSTRERFEIHASVTNANVLVTRAKADFVVLDDETPGTLDPSFNIPFRAGRSVFAIQPDGKILFGGFGTTLERFNPDGTIDPTFVTNGIQTATGSSGIQQIVPLPDGKIYVAGYFSTTNAVFGINNVARLNADGTLDAEFNPMLNYTPQQRATRIEVLAGGDVLVLLPFGIRRNGVNSSILRLDENGAVVWQFLAPTAFPEDSVAEVTDAEDLFTFIGDSLSINKYVTPGVHATNVGVAGRVYAMEAVGETLYLGGTFTNINGVPVSYLARLNTETVAVDTNFNPQLNATVYAIREDGGKLYISGNFTEVNGLPRNRLARLNLDGTLDETFDPGLGPNRAAGQLHVQVDGGLMMGTAFNRVDGLNTGPFVRLRGDAEAGQIRFLAQRIEVSETNEFVTIEVERVGGSYGAIAATLFTVDGSALAGQQFEGTNVTVAYANGEFGRKTVQIPIFADGAATGPRTFSMVLGDVLNAIEATVLIADEQSQLVKGSVDVFGGTNEVRDLAVGANGMIYVGGYFTNVGGISVTNLARLSPNLSPDSAFALEAMPNPTTAAPDSDNPYAPVESLAVRADEKVLYSGTFNSIDTNDWRYLAQLFPDGTYDAPFNTSNRVTSAVNSLARQLLLEPDEKLLAVLAMGVRRINTNGTVDATFGGFTGQILARHPDESLYLADSSFAGSIKKLAPGGFPQNFLSVIHRTAAGMTSAGKIHAMKVLADGSLLIGGDFTHVNQTTHMPRLARVFTNGVVDTNFVVAVGVTGSNPRDAVTAIHQLPGGEIMIGGKLEEVQGVPQRVIALLDADGTLRNDFDAQVEGDGVAEMEGTPDGGVVLRGGVTAVDGAAVGDIFKIGFAVPQAPVARFLWPTNGAEVRVTDVQNQILLHVFDPDGSSSRWCWN